jgi:hypothetical protein
MLSVESRSLAAPPAAGEGDRYIVAASASGGWTGEDGRIASFQNGAWSFLEPAEGWLAWCAAETLLLCFSGGAWRETGARAGGLQNLAELGINTTADATNRLAVAADSALLTHAGGSHRLAINKNTAADTASLILEDGYSARAEIGLVGNDRLSLRVSADGASFTDAIVIDSATGVPSFPQANLLQSYAVNLYQDSGRFAGNGVNAISVGAFAWPAYLTVYNGATRTGLGKFITDNADYGGAAGSLDANVRDLIDMIRDSGHRRYGVEFWVAEVTAGSGTNVVPVTVGADIGYESLFTANTMRAPSMTFHAYLRALDDTILVPLVAGQTARKNGVALSAPFAITPAEGWVSLTIHDSVVPSASFGYQPNIFSVYSKAAGDRYLLACPALMGGITAVDDDIGVVAAYNGWAG